ncbi:MAG: penicillin-binding protein 2, partial [Acidimicrobiia bacterium]|nr:penicillin-binding protein 2 [Acidimicrobiia bacterium]
MKDHASRARLGVLGIVALSLFATLFARLAHLQLVDGPQARLAAERNVVRVVPLPAPRGRILDRDGAVLVDNRASNVVAVDLGALPEGGQRPLLRRLSEELGLPRRVLSARLRDRRPSPYLPVPVAEEVPDEVVVRLRERGVPGVVASRVATRSYPLGTLAAHVLGYVGDEGGRAGVEQAAESDLRGVDGELRLEVDAEGRTLRVLGRRAPVQGHDVVLTLD